MITYSLRQTDTDIAQSSSNHSLPARRAKLTSMNTEPTSASSSNNVELKPCACSPIPNEETFTGTTAITVHHQAAAADSTTPTEPIYDLRQVASATHDSPHKKRNVNWHTPIQIYATFDQNDLPSSSIDPINMTPPSAARLDPSFRQRRSIGEDDGFESLNGKSSSGEDNNHSPNVSGSVCGAMPTTIPTQASQLRLRLNVNSGSGVGIGASSSNNASNTSINAPATDKTSRESTSSCAESDECDDADIISTPASAGTQECNTSATDWLGVTTNSEDCSYTSELDQSDEGFKHEACSDEELPELDITPTTILNPHSSLDRSKLSQ